MGNKFKRVASGLLIAGNLFGVSVAGASAMNAGIVPETKIKEVSSDCFTRFVHKANEYFCLVGKSVRFPSRKVSKAVGWMISGVAASEVIRLVAKVAFCSFGGTTKNVGDKCISKVSGQSGSVKLGNGETVDIVTNTTLTFKNVSDGTKGNKEQENVSTESCSKGENSEVKKEERELSCESFSSKFDGNNNGSSCGSKWGGKVANKYSTFSSRFAEKYGSGSTSY